MIENNPSVLYAGKSAASIGKLMQLARFRVDIL
jgi:hypothetical protein